MEEKTKYSKVTEEMIRETLLDIMYSPRPKKKFYMETTLEGMKMINEALKKALLNYDIENDRSFASEEHREDMKRALKPS